MNSFLLFLYKLISIFIPATRCYNVKSIFLSLAGASINEKTRISSSASFLLSGELSIGENTWIGHEVMITGGASKITIGSNCDLAPRVTLVTGTHKVDINGKRIAGEGFSKPIVINDGSWLCTGSIILGGSIIGKKSIVLPGAIVRGEFPDNSVIGGNPATVIKNTYNLNIDK